MRLSGASGGRIVWGLPG